MVNSHLSAMSALAYMRSVRSYKERFRAAGIEFTRGYVAGRHGSKPRWLIELSAVFWSGAELQAAQEVLIEAGIDLWDCRKELYQ